MNQRTIFQSQILEKLGAPLMAAVSAVAARDGAVVMREAETVATLIGRSVQAGLMLADAMDLRDADGQGDSIRLALASLSAGLVGAQYKQTGKIPDENEIRRMTGALGAVLTFGDNFAPAADNIDRLRALEAGTAPIDQSQVLIQYVNIFAPVVAAVAAFSFGRPEQKLAQDIADRLGARAADMRTAVAPGVHDLPDIRRIELSVLGALAGLYAGCHRAATARLTAAGDAARDITIDDVWVDFERQAAMLELLARSGGSVGAASGGAGPAVSVSPPPSPPSPPPPSPSVAATPPPTGDPKNPMSFFKAKKSNGEQS